MAEKEPYKVEIPADESAKLDAMAASMDAGEDYTPSAETPTNEEQTTQETDKLETQETEPEIKVLKTPKGERKVDRRTGKFISSKPKVETPAETTEEVETEPTSEYAKAKKEEERQRSVLSKFEEEKRAERERLAQKEAELTEKEKKLQQAEAQRRPRALFQGYNADQYYQASKDFARDGDHENAFKALQTAQQLVAYEQQQMAKQQEDAVKAAFESDMEKVIADEPVLKNADDPLSQAVSTVLKEYPELYYLKNGFTKAVSVAKRFMDADNAAELRTKVESLESELTKLRSATTPAIGGPSGPAKEKSFADLTEKEQEKRLERLAEDLDRAA